MTNIRLFALFITAFLFYNCSERKVYGEENAAFHIQRFDTDFYRFLKNDLPQDSLNKYASFLSVYGEHIIKVGTPGDADFYAKLKDYFANGALMDLYKTQQETFADITSINQEVSSGLDMLFKEFPELVRPNVYMHVSGWEQRVVVTDDLLSVSADFYLGKDYKYYQNFFYDYQRELMNPDRIAPDMIRGFLMANYPFDGNTELLLDQMVYEGKLIYLLSRFLPGRQLWEYVGYTKEQYFWCNDNQSRIWKTILSNQHLFTPNLVTTSQYMKEAPYTAFLPTESPGRVGAWVGYQIVTSYMKQKPDNSLLQLMENTNYQEMLKQSKYNP